MAALAAACSLVLSGCFFRSIVGFVDERGGVSLSGNVQAGFCDFGTAIPEFFGCTYTIRDEDGRVIEIISSFELVTESGFLGLLIDPLVLQVPADATNVVAVYNNAGSDEPLVVTETTSFAVTPGVTVQSEAGTKLLILELPDAVVAALPPGTTDFDFSLEFDVADPVDLRVKPMLTARVDDGGMSYYVPVFPCVTDFAQVPEVQIPIGSFFGDLRPQLYGIPDAQQLACDQVTYDFTEGMTPTTTTSTSTTTTSTTTITVPATTAAPTTSQVAAVPTTVGTPVSVLPETGSSTTEQSLIAALVVLAGIALVVVTRRRVVG